MMTAHQQRPLTEDERSLVLDEQRPDALLANVARIVAERERAAKTEALAEVERRIDRLCTRPQETALGIGYFGAVQDALLIVRNALGSTDREEQGR